MVVFIQRDTAELFKTRKFYNIESLGNFLFTLTAYLPRPGSSRCPSINEIVIYNFAYLLGSK